MCVYELGPIVQQHLHKRHFTSFARAVTSSRALYTMPRDSYKTIIHLSTAESSRPSNDPPPRLSARTFFFSFRVPTHARASCTFFYLKRARIHFYIEPGREKAPHVEYLIPGKWPFVRAPPIRRHRQKRF